MNSRGDVSKPDDRSRPAGRNRLAGIVLDPLDMVRGLIREGGPGINIWGPALLAPQLIGGLIFIDRAEGVVVLVGLFVMLATAGYIHRHEPLSRLIGICQAWWLLILPWLFVQASDQAVVSAFSVWLWYVVTTMTISIVLDAYGIHLYLTTDDRTYSRDER